MATADKKPARTLADIVAPDDEAALQHLLTIARQALKAGPTKKSSITDLADAVNTQFRGAQGIAARQYLEYLASDPGSAQRAQILRDVVRLQIEAGKGSQEMSADDMTEEELDKEIVDIVRGAQEKDPGDPHTPEGKALAEAVLLDDDIDEEELELREQINRLEQAEEVDVIAKQINKKKQAVAEKSVERSRRPSVPRLEPSDDDEVE